MKENLKQTLEKYLLLEWLRPENAVWSTVASQLFRDHLPAGKTMEVGTGNGLFTFIMLGGSFNREWDWFRNMRHDGFWEGEDVFDSYAVSPVDFIDSPPTRKLDLIVDHKPSLLTLARELGITKDTLEQDANQLQLDKGYDCVMTNMMYWLEAPYEFCRKVYSTLNPGGRFLTVFPNENFLSHCPSFNSESRFGSLLNRGRKSSMKWIEDAQIFSDKVTRMGFEVEHQQNYLCKELLRFWDYGMRPFYLPLAKMTSNLSPSERQNFKEDWCSHLLPLVESLLTEELDAGNAEGGYTFVSLTKGI